MSGVEDINHVPAVLTELALILKATIEVGVFGEGEPDLMIIASVNEWGCKIKVTPKMRIYLHSQGLHLSRKTRFIIVPERSYIRSSFDNNLKKIIKMIEKAVEAVIRQEITAKQFLDTLGLWLVSLVQSQIRKTRTPPNHPFTIKRKGKGKKPLVNTGRLQQSISYRVV